MRNILFKKELAHYKIAGWDVKLFNDSTFNYRYLHCGGIDLVKGSWTKTRDTLILNSFKYYKPEITNKLEKKDNYYYRDSLKINLEVESDYNYDSIQLYSVCSGEKKLLNFNIHEKFWHKSIIPFSSKNKNCKKFLCEINGYSLPFEVNDYNIKEVSIYIGAAEKKGSHLTKMYYFVNKKFKIIDDSLFEVIPVYRDRLIGIKE